jgi:hypothetical protein
LFRKKKKQERYFFIMDSIYRDLYNKGVFLYISLYIAFWRLYKEVSSIIKVGK